MTPLTGIHGHPGILLVTPRMAVRTPDVFAVFDAMRRGTRGDGAVRMTSEHLAQELGNGLPAAEFLARAGVLAAANDLLAAATVVAPDLVPFRRALTRTLSRPIGLSGSGPTLWTLYPSLEDAHEAASKGVTVNAICPGWVDTDMTRASIERISRTTGRSTECARTALERMSPQNRLITADEVAAVAVFLAGPDAHGINGQTLSVDGGELMA